MVVKICANQDQLSYELKEQAKKQGFDPVGIARFPGSDRLQLRSAALQRWLKAGHQADMAWMASSQRQQADQLLEGMTSLLAVGLNYFVNVQRAPGKLLVARYAWGRDYHRVIKQRLRRVGRWLEQQRPNCRWKICVDTAPLLDKAWAEEAGLGWIGKHSNLINTQRGSWMVLGHLLCTEPLTPDQPAQSLCGKCQSCLEMCPTEAITEPFVIDSRRCLAYHTIENRNPDLPENIVRSLGDWVAGCDICQDVCPWNQQSLPHSNDPDVQPRDWLLKLTRNQALSWSDTTWSEQLRGSALKRIKPWMWRRNAASTQTNKPPTLQKN
ncbi:tRNA epoxyqueuosine(34) reductase QueG [Prochlorococcus sp. MIT 1306]|uniref:tRNA epoxyqueuosine(34) reductase QueG n=1 Tax=Prochlorococcus sp. MIT 1306 TaxID=1799667 RepID=UPI0007B3A886|nr:tRNA epoxyqueuosine(34) reductase QueG [Prochlorococcus sp. MIT 1306]KZR61178.1 Epoxyqueuosine reductase [Prochlorococcus sp. MIT 1306]